MKEINEIIERIITKIKILRKIIEEIEIGIIEKMLENLMTNQVDLTITIRMIDIFRKEDLIVNKKEKDWMINMISLKKIQIKKKVKAIVLMKKINNSNSLLKITRIVTLIIIIINKETQYPKGGDLK